MSWEGVKVQNKDSILVIQVNMNFLQWWFSTWKIWAVTQGSIKGWVVQELKNKTNKIF